MRASLIAKLESLCHCGLLVSMLMEPLSKSFHLAAQAILSAILLKSRCKDSENRAKYQRKAKKNLQLFRLQVFVFSSDVGDAGTVLRGIKVVVAHDQCTRIAAVKVFQELT